MHEHAPSLRLHDEQLEMLAERVAELVADRQSPRLLDAQGAADRLNVPASWVLAEARADRIPHRRLGRYVRFAPDELDTWARGQARPPGRPARHHPTHPTKETNHAL